MPPSQFKPERAVYFNGLPKYVIREEVYKWACTLGWVRKLDLPDGYGDFHNKGYAYIHFRKEKDANSIIAQKKLYWKGHKISVSAYVETRPEEERIPYKYRPGYNSCDNVSMPIFMNPYDANSKIDFATRNGVSTSLSSIESWPSLEQAASINKPILEFSKQHSTRTNVPVTSDFGSMESCTNDETFQQKSDQQIQFSQPEDISQTEIDDFQNSGQQSVSVNGFYLNDDKVALMYNILATEIKKVNTENGLDLSITSNPDLVDTFFSEVFQIIVGNKTVQTC